MGALLGAGKRLLTGESLLATVFQNRAGEEDGRVRRAVPRQDRCRCTRRDGRRDPSRRRTSFLHAAKGVALGIAFTKRFGAGLFGGEGHPPAPAGRRLDVRCTRAARSRMHACCQRGAARPDPTGHRRDAQPWSTDIQPRRRHQDHVLRRQRIFFATRGDLARCGCSLPFRASRAASTPRVADRWRRLRGLTILGGLGKPCWTATASPASRRARLRNEGGPSLRSRRSVFARRRSCGNREVVRARVRGPCAATRFARCAIAPSGVGAIAPRNPSLKAPERAGTLPHVSSMGAADEVRQRTTTQRTDFHDHSGPATRLRAPAFATIGVARLRRRARSRPRSTTTRTRSFPARAPPTATTRRAPASPGTAARTWKTAGWAHVLADRPAARLRPPLRPRDRQEIYTPDAIRAHRRFINDRPYAGWLYGSAFVTSGDERRERTLEMTANRPEEPPSDAQRWWHRRTGIRAHAAGSTARTTSLA